MNNPFSPAGAAYTGWLGYDRVLSSPDIDFIAAPKSYYRNGPNEPGGILGIAQSFNRKKLWMDEIDNHTHLVPGSSCKSFEDTRKVLWREFHAPVGSVVYGDSRFIAVFDATSPEFEFRESPDSKCGQ